MDTKETKERKYALLSFDPDSADEFICYGYHSSSTAEEALSGFLADDNIMGKLISNMKENGYDSFFDVDDTNLSDDDVLTKIRDRYDQKSLLATINESYNNEKNSAYIIVDTNETMYKICSSHIFDVNEGEGDEEE